MYLWVYCMIVFIPFCLILAYEMIFLFDAVSGFANDETSVTT